MRRKFVGLSLPWAPDGDRQTPPDTGLIVAGCGIGSPATSGVETFRCCVKKNAATVRIASATNAATGSRFTA
jgi:hypothetical protein